MINHDEVKKMMTAGADKLIRGHHAEGRDRRIVELEHALREVRKEITSRLPQLAILRIDAVLGKSS